MNNILKVSEFYLKLYSLELVSAEEIIDFFDNTNKIDKEYQMFYLISNNYFKNKNKEELDREQYYFNLGKIFIDIYPEIYSEQDIYNCINYIKLKNNPDDFETTLKIINNTEKDNINTINWYMNQYAKYNYLRFLINDIEKYEELKNLTDHLKKMQNTYNEYQEYLKTCQNLGI